jgi:pilus assembly protein CpaB
LLIGVFLAIVAFVGILMLMSSNQGDQTVREPEELPTVIARADIPLGTPITADQVREETKPVSERDPGAFEDTSQVIGKIVRQPVTNGQQITSTTLSGTPGEIVDIQVAPGKRAMAIQVDQVTGVGTLIKTGDYVDMVLGFTGDRFPVITINPTDDSLTLVSGVNGTTVKAVLQGLQVLGTLLPPPDETTTDEQNQEQGDQGEQGTALTGQQEIVIVALDAQQSEVVKFAQIDGEISLVLRSPQDFIDPETRQVIQPIPDETTGINLKSMVDQYQVLPPEVIEAVIPESQ